MNRRELMRVGVVAGAGLAAPGVSLAVDAGDGLGVFSGPTMTVRLPVVFAGEEFVVRAVTSLDPEDPGVLMRGPDGYEPTAAERNMLNDLGVAIAAPVRRLAERVAKERIRESPASGVGRE